MLGAKDLDRQYWCWLLAHSAPVRAVWRWPCSAWAVFAHDGSEARRLHVNVCRYTRSSRAQGGYMRRNSG
jgi:hypothetical protein